jgi:hypothetical protein
MATPIEITQDEARQLGVYLSDSAADTVLWQFVPWFPRSLEEGTLEEHIREHVREALRQGLSAWRESYPPPDYARNLEREVVPRKFEAARETVQVTSPLEIRR